MRVTQVELTLRPMFSTDWPVVKRIYEEGIATRNATFENEPPDWKTWDQAHLLRCRLVAERGGEIVGWAALSPVSGRCVYAGVAEVSVYLSDVARGLGIGKRLLQALVQESEAAEIWTLQAGIFPENEASIRLHKKCGFRIVGYRERIGQMDGRWRDTVLMERRSAVVG